MAVSSTSSSHNPSATETGEERELSSNAPSRSSSGRCEVYRGGSICSQYRTNATIFLGRNYSQSIAFMFIQQIIQSGRVFDRGECKKALCHYVFPDCDRDTNLPSPVCAESCHLLDNKIRYLCGHSAFNLTVRRDIISVESSRDSGPPPYNISCHPTSSSPSCEFPFLIEPAEENTTASTTVSVNHAINNDTCGGNGSPQGTPCVFPFTYYGIEYEECSEAALQYSGFHRWCGTHSFDGRRLWIQCDCSAGFPVVNSTKELYDGGNICEPYRSNSTVFVDLRFKQSHLSKVMVQVQQILSMVPGVKIDSSCYHTFLRIMCYSFFPKAVQLKSNGSFFPAIVCRSTCFHYYEGNCSQLYWYVLTFLRGELAKLKVNPMQLYLGPALCDAIPPETENCMTFKETIIDDSTDSTGDTVAIVAGVLVPFSVGLLIVAVVCFWRHLKMKKEVFLTLSRINPRTSRGSVWRPSVTSDGMTMREMLDQLKSNDYLSVDWGLNSDEIPSVHLDDIKYIKGLGEGFFGQVFLGAIWELGDQGDGEDRMVAVKVLKLGSEDEVKKNFDAELHVMSLIDHPNIVTLLAKSVSPVSMCMVFEFMCYGDLKNFLRLTELGKKMELQEEPSDEVKHSLTETNLVYMIMQICCALCYLEEKRFVHRDIASRNCLIGKGLTTKLADFGLSKEIYAADYYRVGSGKALLPVRWLAPESLLHGKSSLKSDIWALGILIWEVLTLGCHPYIGMNNEEVIGYVLKGGRVECPEGASFPPFLQSVMADCFHHNPAERPSAAKVLEMLQESK